MDRKIGDLARAIGLTVRTLHHYEDIGLLLPARSDAGHRVYGDDDVERLYRGSDGTAVHAEIEAGDGVLWLHPESPEFGLVSPKHTGASTAMVAVMVDDVDAHFRHTSSRGADITQEPIDQPYGY